jgi:hypothetical protein
MIYSGATISRSHGTLIALAREVRQLFHRFTKRTSKNTRGRRRTISMAIALAPRLTIRWHRLRRGRPQPDLAKIGRQSCILPWAGSSNGATWEMLRNSRIR